MPDHRLDDDRLAIVLASVGAHLVVEGEGTERTAGGRWSRPLLAAAVVLALGTGAVLAIAPARRVVSDWFGAGRVEVELVRDTEPVASLPSFTDAARHIDPAAATEVLGRPMPDVSGSSLGAPSGWWTVPEGGVLVGWADGKTSLWVTRDEALLEKTVGSADVVEPIDGLGDEAFSVAGDHLLVTPHRRVAAESVVVWSHDGLTFRLEGTADTDTLVAIARQLAA